MGSWLLPEVQELLPPYRKFSAQSTVFLADTKDHWEEEKITF